MEMEKLREILRLNEQMIPVGRTEAIKFCVEGELNGRIPRCPCGATLTVSDIGSSFLCTGRDGVSCGAIDIAQAPATLEWRTPAENNECHFKAIIRGSKFGYFIDMNNSVFAHGGCMGQSRSSRSAVEGSVMRNVVPVGAPLTGKALQQIAGAAGAAHVNFQTMGRVVKDNTAPMKVAAAKSMRQIESFFHALCTAQQNRGTMVALVTFDPETKKHKHRIFTASGAQEDSSDCRNIFHFQDAEWKPEMRTDRPPTAEEQAQIVELLNELEMYEEEFHARQSSVEGSIRQKMDLMKWFSEMRGPIVERLEALGMTVRRPIQSEYDDSCLLTDGPKTVRLVACAIIPIQNVRYARTIAANVFCIDGCHVKDGETSPGAKGQILHISTMDGFNKDVLLGFCYCFGETTANFSLIVKLLASQQLCLNMKKNVIMSDRSMAAFSLLARVLPLARHRFCIEHIIRNMRASLKADFLETAVPLVRDAAKALTLKGFEEKMAILDRDHPSVFSYLTDLGDDYWASYTFARDNVATHGIVNNNPAERTGWANMLARHEKSFLGILIEVCHKVAEQNVARQRLLKTQLDEYPGMPYVFIHAENITKEKAEALKYFVEKVDDSPEPDGSTPLAPLRGKFLVTHTNEKGSALGGRHVYLHEQRCECGEWGDQRYPCRHAWAALNTLRNVSTGAFNSVAYGSKIRVEIFKGVGNAEAFHVPRPETLASGSTTYVRPGRESNPARKPRVGRPSKEARIASVGERR